MTGIGLVVTPHAVRVAVRQTLQTWMPSTLAGVLRADDQPTDLIAPPATWVGVPNLASLREDQWPAAAVVSPGTQAVRRTRGYDLTWRVIAAIYTRGQDYDQVADFAGWYGMAMAVALTQHATLGGGADETWLVDIDLDALPPNVARTAGAALVTVDVTTSGAIDPVAGPLTPPEDPHDEPTEPPVVETTQVDVQHRQEE